ncbi:hypothetical protein TCAL_14465 [Tigriopus californicus]|uniref:Uncharacterized protein n=2 Tax=Tigriopus californicus TaxID=6832 RepID=A0A553PSH3_TIGCA|nr:hypothetical protein TCAL_14465 [Tigriopus californicus]
MENILLGNHNIRSIDSDLFVGFLNSTEAYSLTDLSMSLPSRTISVPIFRGAFKGLTLMFDNGILACVGHPMVCHHWNTANNAWVDFPSPNYSHLQGGLVLFDGAPMLVAGWDGVNAAQNLDSVETYDLNSKTWKPGVTLPKPMRSSIIQALNETTVIVSGGYGDTRPLKETYKLVAKSTVWERLEDLPFTWSSQASTVFSLPGLGKGIFAVGYYCGSYNLFERKAWFMAEFDLTWRRLEAFDLPTDLSIMEGQIYRVVDKVIAVPDYEAIAGGSNGFKETMKILTKNVLNLSNPWMIHEMNVSLSGKATYALEVMEYVMA